MCDSKWNSTWARMVNESELESEMTDVYFIDLMKVDEIIF
jgi:hypothetical protein